MNLNNLQESPLVQAATEAKRPTSWWLAIILIVLIAIIGISILVQGVIGSLFNFVEHGIGAQIAETITFAATFLAVAAWVRFKEVRPVRSLGFLGSGGLRRFLIGLAMGAGMLTISVLLMLVLGQYEVGGLVEGGIVGLAALLPALLLIFHWTIQSSTEETLMRGYLTQISALQLPGWVAVLIPAVLFSLLHITESGLSYPVSIINIVFFAILASLIALRQGSLWMVCGIHTGWNWFQGNVFGVPVSGSQWLTHVFSFVPKEGTNSFLSGGGFGPENSLVVTLVWGVAMVIACFYFTSASKPESASTVAPDPAQT